jgi:transcriptional regulator with XRE-family HTH domain
MTYLLGMSFDSEALYKWRVTHNMTQQQAADALGVAAGTLRNWEQGIRRIPATVELLISKLKPSDLPADRGSGGKRPIGVRKHERKTNRKKN